MQDADGGSVEGKGANRLTGTLLAEDDGRPPRQVVHSDPDLLAQAVGRGHGGRDLLSTIDIGEHRAGLDFFFAK
jgi:hypothetical protein